MKILVLGLGLSGNSAVKFLKKKGYEVVGVDDKSAPKEIDDISQFDLFVPSPGIPRTHPLYKRAIEAKIPIKGEAQLGLESTSQPCIAVTGTNGKTTVVKMIEHCLNACGKKAKAVGNVGECLTQHLGDDILVVELSSYQLETLEAKVFDVGIILNITEDHLDRYPSFEEYAKAKAHLQHCMKKKGKLFVHDAVDEALFSEPFLFFEGDNVQAAFLACKQFGVGEKVFFDAIRTFSKPPHRLELIAQKDGVRYFNDSKATNVAAVLHAVAQMDRKVVLIAGGLDKGLSFEALQAIADKLSCVILFGRAREKIAGVLQHLIEVHIVENVQEAVEKAALLAKAEEAVLFSPGCASFDAFKNYEERGEAFKQLVRRRIQ